ncbi:MAG TPA: hypothetical protein VFH08_00855 [Chitinophagaceae bacterium]|nr:hypothetical protein [Chitinophagaceae bacterium]
MKFKVIGFLLFVSLISLNTKAQDEEEEKKKGFNKENLFTGGSISLAFYNNTFLVGGSPVFGYSITNWADLGIVINYNYTSYRDYNFVFNDKLRQYVYGGGGFVKLYPVRFLFAQAQYEYNFIKQKLIRTAGTTDTYNAEAGSFLIGGGYTSGRFGRGGAPFFYLAVLFDISNNLNSPYTDGYGRTIPIIRGGIQIPLFQGGGRQGN